MLNVMPGTRRLAGFLTALVVLFSGLGVSLDPALAASDASWNATSVSIGMPVEETVGRFTRGVVGDARKWGRRSIWMIRRSAHAWGRWLKRALYFVPFALLFALADGGLVSAWRQEGFNVIANYVPLMLYVYGRLLFSSSVRMLGKLLLAAAIVYGVRRRDLIPDRTLIPGMVEDMVFLALATRYFLRTCPADLVQDYAARALRWRGRILTLQRQRGSSS
jgi:uncharacterized membrane protein YkvA (DUF1232 family)